MPILGSCCFCFDLKVGTKIIGIINLVGSIINILSLIGLMIMLLFVDVGVNTAKSLHDIHHSNIDDDYQDTSEQPKNMMELMQEHMSYVKIALYVILGLTILYLITSSMLIHGVRRDRRGLLLPFIVQDVVNIVVLIAFIITTLVVFGTHEIIIGIVLSMLGGLLVKMYFLLVVLSQYQALGLIRMHEEISMK